MIVHRGETEVPGLRIFVSHAQMAADQPQLRQQKTIGRNAIVSDCITGMA
jgi:hypothetical protein